MNERKFTEIMARGISAHQGRRLDEALACYREALAIEPNDAEAISLAGLALLHLDQTQQALPLLLRAVELEPGPTGFRLNLAEGMTKAGHHDRALGELRIVTAADPRNLRAWERAGDVSALIGNEDDAVAAWTRAYSLDPGSVVIALKISRLEIARCHFDLALRMLESAAAREPDHAKVYALKSEALVARRDWPALQATAAAWTRAHPASHEAWRIAARAAFEQGRHVEASSAFARVLALAAPMAVDLTIYASLCLHALNIVAATTALDQAEALDPDYTEMLSTRALLLMYLGRFEDAKSYCRRCLAQDPQNAPAYTTLSRLQRGHLSDADLIAVTQIAQRQDIHLDSRIPAAFSVAHALDALDDVDSAFTAYEYAHALALERDLLENRNYDAAQIDKRAGRILQLSVMSPLETAHATGAPRPIFIVGMPRSGTTLIESVLAAHSRVFACGERPTMQQILRALLRLDEAGHTPDAQTLQEWSTAYFGDLQNLGGADHVTDKHPLNFEAVALIARLLPDALIVHVRRNPVETCLSIYRQEFNKHWTFAHRFVDIGHYYGHCARLIAHWERTLPGRLRTIQYEDFVENFEDAAPQLVQDCGLAWEPRCLNFQHTPRAITTFSTVQVRDAIKQGNGRRKRYEKHLTALVATLERAGVDLETGALRTDAG